MKRCVKLISAGLAICLAFILIFNLHSILFVIMIGSIGEKTITQTLSSPDGTYEAYVISCDEGALGGDTSVYVKKKENRGLFERKEKELYFGEWAQTYQLEWKDDDTLLVDGKLYEMEEIW